MHRICNQTLLFASAVIMLVAGCSSAPTLVFQSRVQKPATGARPAYTHGARRYFSTWATGSACAEDAKAVAYVGVLTKQIAGEIGVKVEGGTESWEEEKNGVYSYKFTSRSKARRVPVQLEGVRVEDSYQECWKVAGDRRCDAYVLVSVPIQELESSKRIVRGRVALKYVCDVENEDACGGGNLDALRESAHRVGLKLIEQTVEEDRPAKALGRELDAAYVLQVRVSADIIGSQKSGNKTAYYARGSGAAELVETKLGKVLAVARTEPMKDGGYCTDSALNYTVQGIVNALCTEIEASDIPNICGGEE